MESWLRPAVRPLVHYADFRGRSTRSELIAFYLLYMFAGILLWLALNLVDFRIAKIGTDILSLALLCPFLALFARRLHDQGRSAWWLLLAAPTGLAGAWHIYKRGLGFPPAVRELPEPAQIALGLSWLAFLVLLFWKDEEGTNRYGPNPRYGGPAAA